MATEETNLFPEIQIMTATELEQSIKDDEKGNETTENNSEEGFILTPAERKEVKVEETENTATITTTTNSSEEIYKALIKELHESGIITLAEADKLEEIPGTKESIKNLLSKTVDSNVKKKEEDWKKGFTGAKKRFLEIEDAFTDTDRAIIMAQRLEFFDSLSVDKIKADKALQKQLYFEDLKLKNFSEEKALAAIEDAEALGKLEERSLESLPDLKKHADAIVAENKTKIEADRSKDEEEVTKSFESLISSIDEIDHFIPGLPLNKVTKDKLKANIITPVHKDESGKEYNSLMYKQSKNPSDFEKLINYFDTLGLFNMDEKTGKFKPDISKLKTVAKTEASSELDQIIERQAKKGVGTNTSLETTGERTRRLIEGLEGTLGKMD